MGYPRYQLRRELFIPLPRAQVFAFFADAANLESITPEFLRFRILTPGPITMRAGTVIDYQLRLLLIPFHWRTVIEVYEPNERFVDGQAKGPYKSWRHVHEFVDAEGGTLMRDVVDYDLPLGPLGSLTHALFVRRAVRRIFDFRNDRILQLLVGQSFER